MIPVKIGKNKFTRNKINKLKKDTLFDKVQISVTYLNILQKEVFEGKTKQAMKTMAQLIDIGSSTLCKPNYLLDIACQGGHMQTVNWLIELVEHHRDDESYYINKWNPGLRGACISGNTELIDLMVDKGATDFVGGLHCAKNHGQDQAAKIMIEKGAIA